MRLLKDRSDLGFDSTAAVTVSKIILENKALLSKFIDECLSSPKNTINEFSMLCDNEAAENAM